VYSGDPQGGRRWICPVAYWLKRSQTLSSKQVTARTVPVEIRRASTEESWTNMRIPLPPP